MISFGLQLAPLIRRSVQLIVLSGNRPSVSKVARKRPGPPDAAADRTTFEIPYRSERIESSDQQRITMILNQPADALERDGTFDFALNGAPPLRLAPTNLPAVLRNAENCRVAQLRSWGLDPAVEALAVTRPEFIGEPGRMFTADDYPDRAIIRGQRGAVVVLASIGADGRVTTCRVIQSSAVTVLDRTTCNILQQRGRFSPGRDAEGKPIPSHVVQSLRWWLPS